MSPKLTRLLAVGAGMAAATSAAAVVSAPAPAAGSTYRVAHGHSIQAAIDRARPGDTVLVDAGVYQENLTITKSRITLRGAGDGARGSVLEPAATPHPSICSEFGEVNGICVTGRFKKGTDILGKPITDTTVTGFLVRHFTRMGILVYNARNTAIEHDRASHTRHYGIVGFSLSRLRVVDNISDANGQGGIHVGDAENAQALISGNSVYANHGSGGIGIYIRSASRGVVRNNHVEGNCAGVLLANTDPTRMTGWTLANNTVHDNTGACSEVEGGGPPLSGLGIGLLGTDRAIVRNNRVTANQPTGTSPLFGGILVASSRAFGGLDPTRNIVRDNRIKGNAPDDLVYDGSGSHDRFVNNTCRTSIPGGSCR